MRWAALFLALMPAVAADLASCVPMRWFSSDPASLKLLDGSPVNCLLLDATVGAPSLIKAAKERGLSVLAIVDAKSPAGVPGADAFVVEGILSLEARRALGKPVIELPLRAQMPLNGSDPVAGTTQGLWPGVRVEKEGATHAGPTSGPWIETNSGFLRFARAAIPDFTALWIANRAPEGSWSANRYAQAAADARIAGARWVISLDRSLAQALAGSQPKAIEAWTRLNRVLAFYETNRALTDLPDFSQLAILQDASSGGLISGGILDMIAAKHIPASMIQPSQLAGPRTGGVRMLLNIDPANLSDAQKEQVRDVARHGATLVNGPPQWKMSLPPPEQITFSEAQIKRLDEIWREINGLIGRRNFAVRVFGAPGVLSNMKKLPDGRFALHLVNYTDYPVEAISLQLLGKFKSAELLTPQGTRKAELYPIEDGTGADIDRIEDVGILLLTPEPPPQPKR